METRTARIGVIGLGYVGLPLSLLLSEAGFKVTGFDIDAKKVADLEAGRSYIFRIPATEIQSAGEKGFTATIDFSGLSGQDAIIIMVPDAAYARAGHSKKKISRSTSLAIIDCWRILKGVSLPPHVTLFHPGKHFKRLK